MDTYYQNETRSTGQTIIMGELLLDGEIRNVNGMLLMTKLAEQEGFATLFMPTEDTPEASLIEGLMVYANESLLQLE